MLFIVHIFPQLSKSKFVQSPRRQSFEEMKIVQIVTKREKKIKLGSVKVVLCVRV